MRGSFDQRSIAFRLALLLALPATLVVLSPPDETQFWIAAFDLGHSCVFAAIAWLVLEVSPFFRPAVSRFAHGSLALLGGVGLGALTELLQSLGTSHDASVADVLRDSAGATAAVIAWAIVRGGTSTARARLLKAVAAGVCAVLIAPLTWTTALYVQRWKAFPVVLPLDGSTWERAFLHSQLVTLERGGGHADIPADAHGLTRLALRPGRYAGIELTEVYPDWRGYRRATFQIFAPLDAPRELQFRIHDAQHNGAFRDRYNRVIRLRPGLQAVSIDVEELARAPERRRLDLSAVRGLMIFAMDLDRSATVFLGPIRLDR